MARETLDEEDPKQAGEMMPLDDEEEGGKKAAAKEEKAAEDADDGDERLAADQRDDDDDEDGEDREAIRARRREEKKHRKAAQREARERSAAELSALRRQNQELAQRLASLENGQLGQSAQMIDQRLHEAVYRARQAEEALAKAVETGNGEVARDAIRLRDRAMNEAQQLDAQRRAIAERAQRPQEQKIDPLVEMRAKEFIERNRGWYDPQGGNEDSAIMLAIDDRLAKEGYDPASTEYWNELEKRASKRLPHRFNAEEDDAPPERKTQRRGGPPVGGRGDHAPASTRREVYVSAERKQAMMEAGVWDDPKLRRDALRRYAEFDRSNTPAR